MKNIIGLTHTRKLRLSLDCEALLWRCCRLGSGNQLDLPPQRASPCSEDLQFSQGHATCGLMNHSRLSS